MNNKKPLFALEMVACVKESFPSSLADFWGTEVIENPVEWFKKIQIYAKRFGASFVSIYFNFDEPPECDYEKFFNKATSLLSEIESISNIPLIIRGTGIKTFDALFLPKLIESLKKPAIIAFAQDNNYKPIVDAILKSHISKDLRLVLRAPIDINLTKELNALSVEAGLLPQQILIDTDTGCVGLGLDYGYSIIERLCVARDEGDELLNMSIIVFAGEETYKAKETKSSDFKESWGELPQRAISYEISTSTALIMAGTNIVVAWNPLVVETLASLYEESCTC